MKSFQASLPPSPFVCINLRQNYGCNFQVLSKKYHALFPELLLFFLQDSGSFLHSYFFFLHTPLLMKVCGKIFFLTEKSITCEENYFSSRLALLYIFLRLKLTPVIKIAITIGKRDETNSLFLP